MPSQRWYDAEQDRQYITWSDGDPFHIWYASSDLGKS